MAYDVAGNNCFKSGITWSTDGQLDFIPGVISVEDCVRICLETDNCKGYTWYGEIKRFKDVCTLFDNLDGDYECTDCISGQKDDLETCICEQKEGQCEINDNNFITAYHSESELDCFLECSAMNVCKYYTWFSSENEEIHQQCLFFSSCESIQSCSSGCFVGGVDCTHNMFL